MVGFKSFADKTRLEFEPGIAAIVGPNGCGKSNIVDAIRWCLGEMSAKSLRSRVLLDVIFNGSANRPATNLSEVSLTFDNSTNTLPIDYSEVTVTRRLFRSGESEYYLNGTPCRLKDIRDLFLDTGIGDSGYSIMEQGRVAYIMEAKPEERRELFEEAAGVSKYKARREEALRKLERIQIDMDRLADVITMTRDQMDKLEAAVRKARQYQKMQDDLKNMEIAHWLWDINQLDEQIKVLDGEIHGLEDTVQQKSTSLTQHEVSLSELKVTDTDQEKRLVALNSQISEVDGRIKLAEHRIQTARERVQEILSRDVTLDQEIAQSETRIQGLEQSAVQLQGALDAEKKTADEIQQVLGRAEQCHQELLNRQNEMAQQNKAFDTRVWEKTQQHMKLQNDIAAEQSRLTRLDSDLKSLLKEKAKSEEKKAALLPTIETLQRDLVDKDQLLQKVGEQQKNLSDQIQDVSRQEEEAQRAYAQGQERYFQTKATLDAHLEREQNDPYALGARTLISSNFRGIHGPLGKIIQVSEPDQPVVRQVLGAHLTDLIADTLEDAQAAIRFLEEQNNGRVRFLVLDRIPPRTDQFRQSGLQGERPVMNLIQCDPHFEPALRLLVSDWLVAGNALYGEGIIEGGASLSSPAGQTATDYTDPFQRKNIEDEISRLRQEMENIQNRRTELAGQKQALTAEFDALKNTHDPLKIEAGVTRQNLENSQREITLLTDGLALTDNDIRTIEGDQRSAEEKVTAMIRDLQTLETDTQSVRDEWQVLQAALAEQQQKTSQAASELAVVKERAAGQQERVQWNEKQLSACRSDLDTLQSSLTAKRQERATSGERVEEQRAIETQGEQDIKAELDQRKVMDQDLEALHRERQALQDRLTQEETALNQLREERENLQNQLHEKKLTRSHSDIRRDTCSSQMKTKYSVEPLEAQNLYGMPTADVNVQELERLRRRIESMGPINLAAPEEHTQLEERYNFLLSQQQDILKAKDDLQQVIQKINGTTRESFRETFDRVRENFKTIFAQLFEGGEADLRFTDETDLLNTGIDIFAQPPGKKLQNISLLSGGEKAMSAVALLFAFFMVRPSPFAIMDEVDAPLDDNNVLRFVNMVKVFSQKSQFLMLTHNKRSMEAADVFYGVTMETVGVSKILSARFKREGAAAEAEAQRIARTEASLAKKSEEKASV